MSDSIYETIEWALNSSRDKLLFGRDELGGALARESRLKGVLLDSKKELVKKDARIKQLEEREKKLIECVRFYADPRNWVNSIAVVNMLKEFYGGERARQTLKELGVNNK